MKACGRAFSRKLQSIIEYYDSKKSCHDHCCDSRLFALHLEEKMEKSYPVEGYGTKREMPFVIPARIREIHRQFLLLSFLPKVITYAPCYYRAVGYDIVKKIENEIYNQFSTLVSFLCLHQQ
uniref:Uncharacterized protein n=1 Tax=Panagrolaimus sp. JU765 TaxID=591449 RepID=A0AC34QJV0_9BILA